MSQNTTALLPHTTRLRSIPGALLMVLLVSGPLRAQTGSELPALLPPPADGTFELIVLGGWGSFSQQPVNDLIRSDNILLTMPTDQGGAGLEKGLDQLTDSPTWGAEVRWRVHPRWSAVAGFQHLGARTELSFAYDPGTGPVDAWLEYETGAFPVWVGALYSTRLSERFTYAVGLSAVYIPASTLQMGGYLGGITIDQEGTASGLGALLTWEGGMALRDRIGLIASVRLRLARIGDPEDDSGTILNNPYSGDPLTLDWSGVDLLLGLRFSLF